jgi:hypothetical protein
MPFWLNIATGVVLVLFGLFLSIGVYGMIRNNQQKLLVALHGEREINGRGWFLICSWFLLLILWMCWNLFG